jgi:large subunit ribosomal protein L24
MKQKWSSKWNSSSQPRKQRKYRFNAPLHTRHKLMSVSLSKELRGQLGKRSMHVRKGEEIKIISGSSRKSTGTVSRVDLSSLKVYVEGITAKKVDGSEVQRALEPSNLMITKLNMDDKMRRKALDRKNAPANTKKPEKKIEKKEEKK